MRSLKLSIWLCVLLTCVGCGAGNWGTATGTAHLDGQPMQKGMVTFQPVASGPSAYAQIAGNGSFKAMTGAREGLPAGDYVITVIDQTVPEYGEIAQITTPAKYASVTTSDLKATIKPGPNTVELQLKK